MREIVVDTETTGLSPEEGDRIVEIGCVELENCIPTGREFHHYVNPRRDVPEEAVRVHGLTAEFLSDKRGFEEVVDEFLKFVGDAGLVIHNAEFDVGFLNMELGRAAREPLRMRRAVDTLAMARKRFPGMPNSLDALCRRFGIDLSERSEHGALLDARLLAGVYLNLSGGRQRDLGLAASAAPPPARTESEVVEKVSGRRTRPARPHGPSPEEVAAHEKFVAGLNEPLWLQYVSMENEGSVSES